MTYPLPRDKGAANINGRVDAIEWLLDQKVAFSPVAYESYSTNPHYARELMFVYFMAPANDPGVGDASNAILRNVATWSKCMSSISIESGMDGLGRTFGTHLNHVWRDYSDWIIPAMIQRESMLVELAQAQALKRSAQDDQHVIGLYFGITRGQLVAFVRSAAEGKPVMAESRDGSCYRYRDYFRGKEAQ